MEWLMGRARGRSSGADKEAAAEKDARPYLEERNAKEQISLGVGLDCLLFRPDGLDSNEWIATHVIALYDNVSTLFEIVYELCSCGAMSAPGGVVFIATDEKGKKIKCTARQYMDSVLQQAQDILNSFPRRYGQSFASDFRVGAVLVCRHLLHIIAHIYGSHFNDLFRLGLTAHLNTVTHHFLLFNSNYHLVEEKEIEVLADLQEVLFRHSPPAGSSTGKNSNTCSVASCLGAMEIAGGDTGSESGTKDANNQIEQT